jgi:adenylate cyclase
MSRSLLAAMLIGGAVCAGVLAVRALGLLQGVELALYEGYLADRAARDATPSPVVIVKLTDADRRELGHWPVNDATLARALERLGAAGARVIGIDLARDLAVPPGSDALDARLRSDARIIGVRSFPDGAASDIPPAPALVGTDRVGFAEMLPDPDGRVRRALLFQADGSGRVEYAFALRVALAYLREAGAGLANEPDAPELVRLGPTAIPRLGPQAGGYVDADAGGYQFLIDFDRAAPGFESLRFTDLLRDELDLSLLRDRVVLIGATAAGAHDIFDTPVASRLEAGGGVPGVELHAHITDQLVRFGLGESPPLDVLPDWAELASIAAVVALGAGVGLAVRSVWLFGALILAGLGLIWVAGLQLFAVGWWAPVAGPGLGWVASAAAVTAWVSSRERAERSQLMQLFSRHLSSEIADQVWARRHEFLDGGRPRPQRLEATVMFLDIKDSTAPGEKLSPEAHMDWVNQFMKVMASTVAEHGGVVDDYFGDGLKADFGVPFPRDEAGVDRDARNAVDCALGVAAAVAPLNARYRERRLPPVAVRVGIHTGSLIAGSLGSEERLKYTTVGDAVVTAQRIESAHDVAHDFDLQPCRILISEQTRSRLGAGFNTEPLGPHPLKGKGTEVVLHRVLGRDEKSAMSEQVHSGAPCRPVDSRETQGG